MLEQLEQRLQANETVIYRAPRRFEPDAWFGELMTYGTCLALLWASGIVSFEPPGLWALIGALSPLALHTLWVYRRNCSTAGLVTDRRLLHRQGWLSPKVTDIPVDQVLAVEAELTKVRVKLRDGTRVLLGHPHDAWGLGVALAHAAGIALPRLATRREIVAGQIFEYCALLILLAISVVVLEWILAQWGWLGFGLLLPIVALISGIAGLVLGGGLALVLGRPFLSFDEAVHWITCFNRLYSTEGDERGLTWDGRLFLWLAERLYGRRAPPSGTTTTAD